MKRWILCFMFNALTVRRVKKHLIQSYVLQRMDLKMSTTCTTEPEHVASTDSSSHRLMSPRVDVASDDPVLLLSKSDPTGYFGD